MPSPDRGTVQGLLPRPLATFIQSAPTTTPDCPQTRRSISGHSIRTQTPATYIRLGPLLALVCWSILALTCLFAELSAELGYWTPRTEAQYWQEVRGRK